MSRVLKVDLTGSNCGPAFRGVEVRGDWPPDWDDDRLRQECAAYYAIPVAQVTVKRRRQRAATRPDPSTPRKGAT